MANDRVAQLPVEVLETSTDLKGRVAQVAVEVLVTSTSLKGRTAQAPVEVLVAPTDANVSATQVAVEVVAQDQNPAVSATQVVIEVVRSSVTTYSSSFTANAHILATVTVQDSISADAVKLQASTGSVDAHSIVLRQISDAITAHAAVLRPYSYSFTASAEKTSTRYGLFYLDAVISVEWGPWTPPESNPVTQQFTLDARYVIRGEGSLTADAYIIRRISGSVAADAIKLRSTSGSVTARATIWKSTSGSITANASIVQRYYGSASADAWIRRTYQKSFTANAAVLKTTASGFSADAVIIYERHYGSFESDALVLRTYEKSFTSNAAVLKTTEGSVTSEAYIIVGRVYGSFTADAVLLRTVRSNWDELVTAYGQPLLWYRMSEASGTFYDSGSTGAHLDSKSAFGVSYQQHGYVDASAWYNGLAYTRTTLNYVVAVGNNLTMEAWVYPTSATRMTILGCNNVDRVIQLEISATQQVSAIENGTFIATSTAGDVTLNAWNHIVYTRSGTSTFTNKIYVNGTQRTLTANNTTLAFLDDPAPRYVGARTTSTQRWAGYIDEVVVYPRVMGLNEVVAHYGFRVAFEARAALLATISQSFTARAAIKRTGNLGEFTADARFCGGGWLPTNAVILRTKTGSFLASAVSLDTFGGTLTADARFCGGGWLSADAAIFGGRTGSFTAKARISIAAFGSFTLDACINPKITADAILLKPTESSITADADITSYARRVKSFTVDSHITGPVTRSISADALISIARSGSFTASAILMPRITADAVISKTQVSSFSAAAWIYVPRTEPPGPNQTPLVQILIEYEGNWLDITDDVILSQAMFTMSVNGAPGQFSLTVRDSGHDYNFVSGAEITVDVDGRRKFGGYVTMVSRQFAFPVDDTTDEDTVDRLWVLTGSDYNILFNTRVLYDKDDPSNVALREWPKGTQDDVIIRYIIDNYTDLAADGVTTDRVKHVGHPNPDRRGVVGSGGLTVGDAMREVNRLIGAVWYLDQWKVLNYVDVDVQSNPIGLSDSPVVGQSVGYRELEHNSNGTSLFNDALVWGTGKGSEDLTFSREQDGTSQDAHGRWQYGEFTSTLYKQASVDLRASTVINGVPQSGRGAKNDKVSWTVTTYEMSFQVGQVVEIESEAFGLAPTSVPIRRWTMTFPTKRDPQFQLILSHEIDEPWNMYEFYFPKFSFNYRAPKIDTKVEVPCKQSGGTGTCDETVCGITDTFTRYVSGGWGTSDAGLGWEIGAWSNGTGLSVDGTAGVFDNSTAVDDTMDQVLMPVGTGPFELRMSFVISSAVTESQYDGFYIFRSIDHGSAFHGPLIRRTDNQWYLYISGYDPLPGDISEVPIDITLGEVLHLHASWNGARVSASIWADGVTEPSEWMVASGDPDEYFSSPPNALCFYINKYGWAIKVHDLDIIGINKCSALGEIDNFNRVVASGLGTASSGTAWVETYNFYADYVDRYPSVDGSCAKMAHMAWGYGTTVYSMPADVPQSFIIEARIWPDHASLPQQGGNVTIGVSVGEAGQTFTSPMSVLSPGIYFSWGGYTGRQDAWYIAKVRRTPTGLSYKYYAEGSTEPDWSTESPAFGGYMPYDHIYIGFWSDNTRNYSGYVYVDYIRFYNADDGSCFSDCSSGDIDKFERTVATGWGTSLTGQQWTTNHSSRGSAEVDGNLGILAVTNGTFPNVQGYAETSIPFSPGADYEITTRFRYNDVPEVAVGYFPSWLYLSQESERYSLGVNVRVGDWDYSNALIELDLFDHSLNESVVIDSQTVSLGTYDWTTLVLSVQGQSVTATIGTTTLSITAPTNISLIPSRLLNSVGLISNDENTSFEMHIDYIFTGCFRTVAQVIDDWDNRAVALTEITTNDSVSPWGATSETGDPWYAGGPWGNAGSVIWMGVEDGIGRVKLTNPPNGLTAAYITMNIDGTTMWPWLTIGDGVPEDLFIHTSVTFSLDVMCDSVDFYGEIWLASNRYSDHTSGIYVGFEPTSIILDTYDAGYTSTSFTWSPNVWYTVKISIIGTEASVKVWERGQSEPSSVLLTRYTDPLPWTPGAVELVLDSAVGVGSGYTNYYIDNFVQYTTESGIVYPPDTSVLICEEVDNSVASAGQKVFTLPAAFIPDSTRVWVDGLFQRPGYAYEENPPAGKVTFYTALSGGELVHIEYVSDEDT